MSQRDPKFDWIDRAAQVAAIASGGATAWFGGLTGAVFAVPVCAATGWAVHRILRGPEPPIG